VLIEEQRRVSAYAARPVGCDVCCGWARWAEPRPRREEFRRDGVTGSKDVDCYRILTTPAHPAATLRACL